MAKEKPKEKPKAQPPSKPRHDNKPHLLVLQGFVAQIIREANKINFITDKAKKGMSEHDSKEMVKATNFGVMATKEYFDKRMASMSAVIDRVPNISENIKEIADRMQQRMRDVK